MNMIPAVRKAATTNTESRFDGVQLIRSGGDVFVPVAMYNTLKDQHQQAVQERDVLALEVDAANDRVAEVMDERDHLLAALEALLAAKDEKDAALNNAAHANSTACASTGESKSLGRSIGNLLTAEANARAVLAAMKARA